MLKRENQHKKSLKEGETTDTTIHAQYQKNASKRTSYMKQPLNTLRYNIQNQIQLT